MKKTTWIEVKEDKPAEIFVDELAKPVNAITVYIPATVRIEEWGDFIDIYIEEEDE